eukprot:355791-Chlamydomonas_euryale.AAC.4
MHRRSCNPTSTHGGDPCTLHRGLPACLPHIRSPAPPPFFCVLPPVGLSLAQLVAQQHQDARLLRRGAGLGSRWRGRSAHTLLALVVVLEKALEGAAAVARACCRPLVRLLYLVVQAGGHGRAFGQEGVEVGDEDVGRPTFTRRPQQVRGRGGASAHGGPAQVGGAGA